MSKNPSTRTSHSEKIKNFKSNYQIVEQVLNRYLSYKQRIKYQDSEGFKDFPYWKRYVEEIDWILNCMNEKEKELLEEKFLNKKNSKVMYISSSKYYSIMNVILEKFLINLEISLINPTASDVLKNTLDRSFYIRKTKIKKNELLE